MGTDIRKHTAPLAGETPSRQVINDLSLTVNDVIPIANTTARAQLVADLTAAGFTPSQTKPLYVHRADAGTGQELEVTTDGTTWRTISAPVWTTYTATLTGLTLGSGGSASTQWRREGDLIRVRYHFVLGSSAGMSQPRFSLPVTSVALRHTFEVVGHGSVAISGARYASAPLLASTTLAQVNYLGVSGILSDLTLAAPAAWLPGDSLAGELVYRPAF